MKSAFRLLSFSLLLGVCGLFAELRGVSAGVDPWQVSSEAQTRALFRKKEADGMSVVISRKDENGNYIPVNPAHVFTEGDEIRVAIKSNFRGYLYLVNVTPGGKRCLLFPEANRSENPIPSDTEKSLGLGFDNEKGTEVLQVIMSRTPISTLDNATRDDLGCLTDSVASAAAELEGGQAGIVINNITPVVKDEKNKPFRSRDIGLAAGRDKEEEGSVVAVPGKDGKGDRLKEGDAILFEIRLKHN